MRSSLAVTKPEVSKPTNDFEKSNNNRRFHVVLKFVLYSWIKSNFVMEIYNVFTNKYKANIEKFNNNHYFL